MVIAKALARTSVYYRRTGLLSALIALGGVVGTLLVEQTVPKGGMLGVAVLFAAFSYRSLRAANRYVDPKASPVLLAIAEAPEKLAKVTLRQEKGKPCYVVLEDADGDKLDVRIDFELVEERVPPLLDALAARFPQAEMPANAPARSTKAEDGQPY